jgi:chromosomal replication initiator protein
LVTVITSDLDPRLTFESFVVGPANRLASAAARRAADAPGSSYNPLFIYSPSGLGKSHILSAIAHYAARVHPEWEVKYLQVEGFLDELAQALEEGKQEELRGRYEGLNFLLLDEVQFLTGHQEAQEMLLRLLDALSMAGSQIVLAADRTPSEIDGLDARLVSRFAGGLIVDMAAPEYETRVAILNRKAEERGQKLEDGVAQTLARLDFRNVRELAGALNKILAIQELEGRQVSADEAGKLVGVKPATPSGEDLTSDLLGEFGSFIEELSTTVAQKVEHEETPWRRQLRETADVFEQDAYSATRLRRLLESDKEPPDVQQICDQYREDIAHLRHISAELDRVGNPWPEAAIGILKDPERVDEGESLLASAIERVRPFPIVGEGPDLEEIGPKFPEVAAGAAEKLITEERPEYNPLYLWSSSEKDALALMAATARSFKERDPMGNIAITSAEEFGEDFIRALGEGVAGAWRERWWTVDLLIVYGVQALSETERAQDEFFHLFEAAKRRGAKLLITANRPPSGIGEIDERLRSRFESGLAVEVTATDLPVGAGDLNLQEAPPEYIQDDDLWAGFDRPRVRESRVPEFDLKARDSGAPLLAEDVTADAEEVATTAPVAAAMSSEQWRPSRDAVVWEWPDIDDRIVEENE